MDFDPRTVAFYTETNLREDEVIYNSGDVIVLKGGDKYYKKFLSCIIGASVECKIFEHGDGHGKSETLKPGSYVFNLSHMNGISRIEVKEGSVDSIMNVRFEIGVNLVTADSFKLTLTPQKDPFVIPLCKNYSKVTLPKLDQNPDITIQVSVQRVESPSEIVASGPAYFKYDSKSGRIYPQKNDKLASSIFINQIDHNSFVFALVGLPGGK
ncbi:hypothetical protein DICPUDRAFT_155380 [Dictyostelium purpureum]|uniref:Uncharacterized protein n=1 Tax=Dictyostelium purpureum TaxID=5786 RepID=F0ZTU8_DICPU|nr:uncharacterized protein DICPUDRAFT_155380 [Dictyostelium purpureum]EGC32638.1 hypothetical protein DICPUDRAFT_155380 [Dictyostelium purpureum]|eukprot:XP_003290853.1 hypothetical protein DICPUDRAFT_155380 [Dictyostelium purpureum]